MLQNSGEWLWAALLAALGIVARLGHTWAQSKEGALPPLSRRDVIGALIAAPALGIIAYGLGSWLGLSGAAVGAACGFAGLLGPAANDRPPDRQHSRPLARRDRGGRDRLRPRLRPWRRAVPSAVLVLNMNPRRAVSRQTWSKP